MSLKDCVECDKKFFTHMEEKALCDNCQGKIDEKRFYVSELHENRFITLENAQKAINHYDKVSENCRLVIMEIKEEYKIETKKELVKIK